MANFCEGRDGIDICRHPRDYFPWLDEDAPATTAHQDCWVGMSTVDDFGQQIGFTHRGQACEIGCASCRDLPLELDGSRAPVDGMRWLHPHPTMMSIDATGRKMPLRASKVNLIPRLPQHYLAAPCFDNSGIECFGGSVCACYGERSGAENFTGTSPLAERCIPTGGGGWFAKGFFPSQFMYSDMTFPPITLGFGGSLAGGLFCRTFEMQNEDGTPRDEDLWVALQGGEMFSPAFIRNMFREPLQADRCVVNTMVRSVSAVAPSICSDAYANAWEFSQPPGREPDFYNASPLRTQFARIRVGGNPHFRDLDNKFDGLSEGDLAHIKAKNEAIETAKTFAFPTRMGTIRFDQVDHEFGYGVGETGPLNTWGRSWSAVDEGIDPVDLPKIEGYPIVGRWRNLPLGPDIPADLVISRVDTRLWLMPISIEESRRSPAVRAIEYHARYRMFLTLTVRINLEEQFVSLRQPWLPEGHPDRDTTVLIDYGNHIEEPTLSRDDLDIRLVFTDPEGTAVDLPTRVEWLGYLGQISYPTAASQRFEYGGAGIIQGTLEGARNLEIPGWPFAHGTTKDDPGKRDTAQIHGGKVTIGFV